MAQHQYRTPLWALPGLLVIATLSGCSGFGGNLTENRQQINVTSDPDGATVIAEGVEIGKTPLAIRPGDVFQARFTSGSPDEGIVSFRYVGTLALKKPGCDTYSTQVNDNLLSKDIDVKLVCDPNYQPVEVKPASPAPTAAPPEASAPPLQENRSAQSTGTAEERLQRIESLYKKGLLSDQEYKALRQRVLDTL